MALELKPGDRYDKFQVLEVLRKHPASWVYKVQAEGYQQPLALKLSLDPVESEEIARRALREVAVLGNLTNDHVVRVHDSGMGPDDHWYILMEHLEGAQLNHWHDFDRPMPAADGVDFIHQACLGLAEVHAAEIVHRDLKPENLWVRPNRQLEILDFGSARSWGAAPEGDNVTVGHVLVGSPRYAAPEQLYATQLTPAADVYSLGVMLYELLSGRTPFFADRSCSDVRDEFADDPSKWIRAHAQNDVVPITRYSECAELPKRLVDLVNSMLAKGEKDRPADAGAVANELGWILHHDLGKAQGATLRVTRPDGALSYHLLLPGSQKVGFSPECEIRLALDQQGGAHALLEWSGPPKHAEIRPLGNDGTVAVNGGTIESRAALGPDDQFSIGSFQGQITYASGS